MDKDIVNRDKSLAYLCDKIIKFFKSHDYVEGSYNDNRFVEYCHKVYQKSWNEDVFDIRDLDLLLWSGSDQQLSVKVLFYLKEEKGPELINSDVFCKHEIEYIDWAFSDASTSSTPAVCDWNVEKYRDYIEDDKYNDEINKAHRKWKGNVISKWWIENKGKNTWEYKWGEPIPLSELDDSDIADLFS